METVDRHTTIGRTLPLLQVLFGGAQLVFLMGSDTALSVPQWQHSQRLLASCGLVVGVRSEHQSQEIDAAIRGWAVLPSSLTILESYAADVSSSQVRQALRANQHTKGLLASVKRYARHEWLYVTLGA